MISWPTTNEQTVICRELIRERCGAAPHADAHYLVWLRDNVPEWVVAIDGWVGQTCQLTMASTKTRPVPRELARTVFHYVFNVLKRKRVFALVDEDNQAALRIDHWLGFREEARWPELATSGKALLLLSATPESVRFYERLQ